MEGPGSDRAQSLDEAKRRFYTEPNFYAAVNTLRHWLEDGDFTVADLRQVALLAEVFDDERVTRERAAAGTDAQSLGPVANKHVEELRAMEEALAATRPAAIAAARGEAEARGVRLSNSMSRPDDDHWQRDADRREFRAMLHDAYRESEKKLGKPKPGTIMGFPVRMVDELPPRKCTDNDGT